MIIDIILIAVIVLFAVIGMKRGIAKTLLNIAGLVLSAIAAYYLAGLLSRSMYDAFIKQTVMQNIQQIIQQNGADYAVNNCLEAMPAWINGVLSFIVGLFGMTVGDFEKHMTIPDGVSESVAQTVENTVAPVITSLLEFVFLVVLFIVLFIIAKKLVKLASKVFDIPVIKQINRLLGGVLGIAEGVVIVFVAANILGFSMQFSNPVLLNGGIFSGAVFKFFCLDV